MTQETPERPCDLNKKIKRLHESRDNAKKNIRNKAKQNKALRDRNVEITANRDHWKARSKELNQALERQTEEMHRQLQAAQEEIERERRRAEEERKRADELRTNLEEIWKKKSGTY